jgi:hypothetical protein
VSITCIDNHQVKDLEIVTAAGYGITNQGPVIYIMRTIHASGHLEFFKLKVDERSRRVGGKQSITTPDGYINPLNIVSGLSYFSMRVPTDKEMDTLPHVILTSDIEWDSAVPDNDINPDDMD